MKIFKCALFLLLLSFSSHSVTHAADEPRKRGGLLKMWKQKKEDTKRIEAMAKGVTSQLDVPYLNDKDPKHRLDIYFPAKKQGPMNVLLHIHGGGWKMGDKKLMKSTGLFYASQGVLFIAPNYRLSPKVQHPAHIEDCAAALAWVFENVERLGGDQNRIFVSGHSAGAHLAALLGTNQSYLAKYSVNPSSLGGIIPVDTASFDLLDEGNEKLVKKFVDSAFGTDENVLRDASPLQNISSQASYPRFLIFNTTEREAAAKGGHVFADKLKAAGCDARFIPVDNHTHGEMASGMYDAADPVGREILKFIFQQS